MADSLSFLRNTHDQDYTQIIRDLQLRVQRLEQLLLYATPDFITTPPVPASGVDYTWTGKGTVTIYIFGGTVTQVVINYTGGFFTLAVTGGTFRLVPGDTISITYTVAPSWAFYGA
jgi:hypothetical protein